MNTMKKLTGYLAALLLFLLPLKFGGLAVMPESGGFFPEFFCSFFQFRMVADNQFYLAGTEQVFFGIGEQIVKAVGGF